MRAEWMWSITSEAREDGLYRPVTPVRAQCPRADNARPRRHRILIQSVCDRSCRGPACPAASHLDRSSCHRGASTAPRVQLFGRIRTSQPLQLRKVRFDRAERLQRLRKLTCWRTYPPRLFPGCKDAISWRAASPSRCNLVLLQREFLAGISPGPPRPTELCREGRRQSHERAARAAEPSCGSIARGAIVVRATAVQSRTARLFLPWRPAPRSRGRVRRSNHPASFV